LLELHTESSSRLSSCDRSSGSFAISVDSVSCKRTRMPCTWHAHAVHMPRTGHAHTVHTSRAHAMHTHAPFASSSPVADSCCHCSALSLGAAAGRCCGRTPSHPRGPERPATGRRGCEPAGHGAGRTVATGAAHSPVGERLAQTRAFRRRVQTPRTRLGLLAGNRSWLFSLVPKIPTIAESLSLVVVGPVLGDRPRRVDATGRPARPPTSARVAVRAAVRAVVVVGGSVAVTAIARR
jgi:hypothetical protein